jgi:phosphoribosylamine--glycine ligase
MASPGYPETSKPLLGLPQPVPQPNVAYFWGGSKLTQASTVDASGGRVLTVTALGSSIGEARERAYAACSAYSAALPPEAKLRYRVDIGERAVDISARH